MALRTQDDALKRMALVPRVLEARGLDVTPGMIKRLKQIGDDETIVILDIILADEIGHVAIGSKWYKYCCDEQNVEPIETFRTLIQNYMKTPLKSPFYEEGRLQAGFSKKEIEGLLKLEEEMNKSLGRN